MQSSMLTTQEFIKSKCSKDHFSNQSKDHVKHSSVYTCDFKSKKKFRHLLENNSLIAKQRNTPVKVQGQYLYPLSSVYRNSFEQSEVKPPVKYQEKPSYFLKSENYEPINSTYNRNSVLKQADPNCAVQKGRPQMDNLCVPKTNKMNAKSLYRESYTDYTKLPSIHIERNMPRYSELKQNSRFTLH